MKKKLIFSCLILFTGYILIFPQDAVAAAAGGLVLWYEKVLPTLLPFAILSNILIYSGYLQYLNRLFAPLLCRLFPVSANGAFILLSGFLFGFPMGSKNCAELLKCGRIDKKEADVLFVITNNISPVFISSYILCQQLKMPSLIIITYLILYLPPLILAELLLRKNENLHIKFNISRRYSLQHSSSPESTHYKQEFSGNTEKSPASQMNFKIIDAGIMNGFETLTRLGGYIMLFSMIASMIRNLPLSSDAKLLLTGMTEITNGISLLPTSGKCNSQQYILAMAFTAFGGLSGIAQTSSMTKDTGLSLKKYSILKIFLAVCAAILAWGVTVLLHI